MIKVTRLPLRFKSSRLTTTSEPPSPGRAETPSSCLALAGGPDKRTSRRDTGQLLALGALALLLFVLFTVVTKALGSNQLDRWSHEFANQIAGGVLHSFFGAAEPFGSPGVSLLLALALATAVVWRRNVVAGVAVLAALGLMTAIEGLLRIRLDALPWEHLVAFLEHPRGWHLIHSGYPSGHTARLGLIVGIAAANFLRRRPTLAIFLVLGVTAWIGFQRVESGRHTGADVIGGALLAWGLALFYAAGVPWFQVCEDALKRRARR